MQLVRLSRDGKMEGAQVLTDRHVFALTLVYMWVRVAFREPMRTLSSSAKAAGWMRGAAPPVTGYAVGDVYPPWRQNTGSLSAFALGGDVAIRPE